MRLPTHRLAVRVLLATVLGGSSYPAAVGNEGSPTNSAATQSRSEEASGWWLPGSDRPVPARVDYPNETGMVEVLNSEGALDGKHHPFFEPLGTNGRACVTCHQPMNGMSVTPAAIRARWQQTHGADPIFAAVDGSNCPPLPQADERSHSLLLERGLFRIPRPWPPRDAQGRVIQPEFTLKVVRDPTGCNFDPRYGLHGSDHSVSVFRRPRPVANLKYAVAFGYVFEPKNGLPLPYDPVTGLRYSGNLMADQRDRTLAEQARDALLNHLELRTEPSRDLLAELTRYESQLYVAQAVDHRAGSLVAGGAGGGPETLLKSKPGVLKNAIHLQWAEFAPWESPDADPAATPAQREFRRSVARGAALFRDRTFLISNSAGLNSMNFGNPTRDSCNFCHNMTRTGMDVAPGQVDLGTTNEPFADPDADLPLFQVTCPAKHPHPFLGTVIYTHDPGFALTTGKCADVGKITIQSMRGLAARPPYFSNGSAASLRDVIDFYERRYNIGLSEQDKQDLINLLSVL